MILGIGSLGAGYYIAVTTRDALRALEMYFVAVVLVIIGTYCLFAAVSIAVLKALRQNKRLYYQTPHVIGISGMLYRMNRNAVGLANLCILATMVLVMVSVTLSLYVGTEESLNTRYPSQLNFTINYDPEEGIDRARVEETLTTAVEKQGLQVTKLSSYADTAFGMERTADGFRMSADIKTWSVMVFLPAWGYNSLTGEHVSLEPGKLLTTAKIPSDGGLNFTFVNPDGEARSFQYEAESMPADFTLEDYGISNMDCWYFILPGDAELNELAVAELWTQDSRSPFTYFACGIDTDGDAEQQIACANALRDAAGAGLTGEESFHWLQYRMEGREWNREEFYLLNGGFFFLGIFLGIIFLMAMVLIMYYKQISEGYEDRERFAIMQQVGLEKREIRRSINVQVLVVFFAPLLVAGVHVIFDFNLVSLLMILFSMTNRSLAIWCTLGSFAAFALIYALVYALTARTYYRIVSE